MIKMDPDPKNLSLWQSFLKQVKKGLNSFRKVLAKYTQNYPDIFQIIQLTFIYFFALIDLIYSVLSNVYALGYFPELLRPFYPTIQWILQSPILRIWASPEKVFFLSYVVIEFMVVRSTFKFSKLVKYNILLIFALLMLQGLAISYWDVIFNREIASPVAQWAYDGGTIIFQDKVLAITFFLNTFYIFICLYAYLYLRAIQGKFATILFGEWLTDSIAFWVRIKTPTMRAGKRKKEKKEDDDNDDDGSDKDKEK
jgi:hypothetical protein